MWTVSKEFHFDAAHSLPHLPPSHKCHHLHGHTYKVVVHCSSGILSPEGWVVDYADIKAYVQPIIDLLDHKNINVVLNVPTTAENLARWIYNRINLGCLRQVDVHETTGTCCTYRPE